MAELTGDQTEVLSDISRTKSIFQNATKNNLEARVHWTICSICLYVLLLRFEKIFKQKFWLLKKKQSTLKSTQSHSLSCFPDILHVGWEGEGSCKSSFTSSLWGKGQVVMWERVGSQRKQGSYMTVQVVYGLQNFLPQLINSGVNAHSWSYCPYLSSYQPFWIILKFLFSSLWTNTLC